MRYSVNLDALQRQIEETNSANARLVEEIRNLRCVMLEAAASISPVEEPELFARLIGKPEYFVTNDVNPYPEHDGDVGEQYLVFLSYEANKND